MVGAYAMGFVTLLSFPYLQKMVGGSAAHQYAVIGAVLGIIAAVMTLACAEPLHQFFGLRQQRLPGCGTHFKVVYPKWLSYGFRRKSLPPYR